MQDALTIYHTAVQIFQKEGHTFLPMPRLHYKRQSLNVAHWDEALGFLSQENVMKTEEIGYVGRVAFLPRMRNYESNIAESIAAIMQEPPWILSAELDEKVGAQNVIYICGKTTTQRWSLR